MSVVKELPRYKCHKEVWALKIKDVLIERRINGRVTIIPEDTSYASFDVSQEYYQKHNPKPGGYYVVYEDGYNSWSPAEAFESGYTKI